MRAIPFDPHRVDANVKMSGLPVFAAYVYPGWHMDSYRPTVDEWELLYTFHPYFSDHLPPPMPLDGPYDDSSAELAANHLAAAVQHGIGVFTYFLYYHSQGFVMNSPLDATMAVDDHRLQVATTWCFRLPHDRFPVMADDDPALFAEWPSVSRPTDSELDRTPVRETTLADLPALIGPDRFRDLDYCGNTAYASLRREQMVSTDMAALERILTCLVDLMRNNQEDEGVALSSVAAGLRGGELARVPVAMIAALMDLLAAPSVRCDAGMITLGDLDVALARARIDAGEGTPIDSLLLPNDEGVWIDAL